MIGMMRQNGRFLAARQSACITLKRPSAPASRRLREASLSRFRNSGTVEMYVGVCRQGVRNRRRGLAEESLNLLGSTAQGLAQLKSPVVRLENGRNGYASRAKRGPADAENFAGLYLFEAATLDEAVDLQSHAATRGTISR